MNKLKFIALAALGTICSHSAFADNVPPPVSQLVNGDIYFIYDAHGDGGSGADDRYGFRYDNGGTEHKVYGTHCTAANSAGQLAEKHAWVAIANGTNWKFRNVSTGYYIYGVSDLADDTSQPIHTTATESEIGSFTLEPFTNDATGYTFAVKVAGSTNTRWDGVASNWEMVYWNGSGHPTRFYQAFTNGTNYSVTHYAEPALAEGTQVTINQENGTFANGVYTTNATVVPGVKVTLSSGSETDGFRDGWIQMSPRNGTRTITIESTDPGYYVKAFKFRANTLETCNLTLSSASNVATNCSVGHEVKLYETEIAEGTPATFSVAGTIDASKKITFKDFVVVLAPVTVAPENPAGEGYIAPSGKDIPATETATIAANFLTRIWTEDADKNIDISYTSHPGIYNKIEGIEAGPGESFFLNLVANSLGGYSESTVHEDLRFDAAHIFVDWEGNGEFEDIKQYGDCPPVQVKGGNYYFVMNIIHEFVVPADAVPGTKARIRVIYQNAWTALNNGANSTNLTKGIAYDFVVSIDDNVQVPPTPVDQTNAEKMDRTNWSIRACSQEDDNPVGHIFDDNNSTIWHSSWSTGTGKHGLDNGIDHPHHFFVVDLDKNNPTATFPVSGIEYLPNQTEGQNGICMEYRVYVLDNIEGLFVDGASNYNHDNLDAFISDKHPFINSAFAYTWNSSGNNNANEAARSAYSDYVARGHYVLFVFDATRGNDRSFDNKFATCAEFNVYLDKQNPKQPLYDEFAAEIYKYIAVGFPSTWVTADGITHTVANSLDDIKKQIDNDAATVDIFKSLIELKRSEILNNITPKGLVRIESKTYQGTTYFAASESALGHSSEKAVPTTLWRMNYKGNNKFTFHNYHAQKYLGHPTTKEEAIPFVDDDMEYELVFCEGEDYFALAHSLEDYPYIRRPYRTATDGSIGLTATGSMSDYAKWHLVTFAGAELEDGSNEGVELATKNTTTGDVTVTFQTKEGVDLTVLEDAYYEPAHMRITVSGPRANAPMRREASLADGLKGTELDSDGGEYSFTIPAAALGNYTINVPAGFFSTNGDLTAAQSIGLTVKANSATTSISEVGIEAVDAEGVYDLQGRRLVAPVKGINIINGKKILVK